MPPEMISRMRRPCSTDASLSESRSMLRTRRRRLSQAIALAPRRGFPCEIGTNFARRLLSFRRCQMIKALTPDDGGSGEAEGRDSRGQLKSPRERAAHYRKYATQFRALAGGEENPATREKLLQIVRQYE